MPNKKKFEASIHTGNGSLINQYQDTKKYLQSYH